MPIVFDDSQAPVTTVTYHGAISEAEFDMYLVELTRRLMEAHARIAYVYDARPAHSVSTQLARKQGMWVKEHREPIRRVTAGTAFVFDGAGPRFLLSTIFLIEKPACPYLVTGSMAEAHAWCVDRLEAR